MVILYYVPFLQKTNIKTMYDYKLSMPSTQCQRLFSTLSVCCLETKVTYTLVTSPLRLWSKANWGFASSLCDSWYSPSGGLLVCCFLAYQSAGASTRCDSTLLWNRSCCGVGYSLYDSRYSPSGGLLVCCFPRFSICGWFIPVRVEPFLNRSNCGVEFRLCDSRYSPSGGLLVCCFPRLSICGWFIPVRVEPYLNRSNCGVEFRLCDSRYSPSGGLLVCCFPCLFNLLALQPSESQAYCELALLGHWIQFAR
jgi:hypothetical protein